MVRQVSKYTKSKQSNFLPEILVSGWQMSILGAGGPGGGGVEGVEQEEGAGGGQSY